MRYSILIVMVICLVACGQPTTTAVVDATRAIPIATATQDYPTQAAPASSTATTKSIIIYPTATITPTPWERLTDEAESTDGKWTASFFACAGASCAPHIRVMNNATNQIWTYEGGAGSAGNFKFAFYRWSQDGRFLYFAEVSPPNLKSELFYDGQYGLLKLDLETGGVTSLLPHAALTPEHPWNPANLWSYPESFALAPAETKIAYTLLAGNAYHLTRTIIIRNLASQSDVPIAVYTDTYSGLGAYVWSPDETSVIFALATFTDTGPDRVSLLRLDLSDLSLHTLIKDDKRWLRPVQWDQDSTVIVYDFWARPNYWALNPVTGALTLMKPTPTPAP